MHEVAENLSIFQTRFGLLRARVRGLVGGWMLIVCAVGPAIASPLGIKRVDEPLATGHEILVATERGVVTISPDRHDDVGELPVPGPVTAALRLREHPVLVLHVPERNWLGIVDVDRFSEGRFGLRAEYRAPELARRARFVRAGTRWYLADGDLAIALLDPRTLAVELGQYAADHLPVVGPGGIRMLLSGAWYVLERGQLTVETIEPHPGHPRGPVQVALPEKPVAMVASEDGRRLWLGTRRLDGTGRLVALDTTTRQSVGDHPIPWAVSHLTWCEDGQLAVLGRGARKLGLFDVRRRTFSWARGLSPRIRPAGLLPLIPVADDALVPPAAGVDS